MAQNSAMSNARKAPIGQIIQSLATHVALIRWDCTGSNASNEEIFRKKLPLLYQEAAKDFPDLEISFGVVGDAYSDNYPLQIRQPNKGPALGDDINALYSEGGGGGQGMETYELMAEYDVKRVEIPNAVMPLHFLLCDEGFYPKTNPQHVRDYIGIQSEAIPSGQIFAQLQQKYNAWVLRCKYSSGYGEESKIHAQWQQAFGVERVLMLDEPARVVDCILGIMAHVAGTTDAFVQSLTSRQTGAQVKSVMNSLRFVHQSVTSKGSGNSIVSGPRTSRRAPLQSKKLV
ncbi:MAG: hypothetical protein WCX88_01295 [Patescibacteria group bacterium]